MSKAMQLVGIILLGVFTLVIINLMNDARSTDELDYYLLQEVTEASMYDAVDYSYYRESGLLKVDRDMFLESFNRRFAQSVANNRSYDIKIVDFNETPPKASIEVTAATIATVKSEVALITNRVNGIIETIYDDYVYSRGDYSKSKITEKPTVEVAKSEGSSVYKVSMHDNTALEKYWIGYDPNGKMDAGCKFNESNVRGIASGEWISIPGLKTDYNLNIDKQSDKYKTAKCIIVMNRAGLFESASLVDQPPTSSINNSNELVLKDDIGISGYTIKKVNYAVINGNHQIDKVSDTVLDSGTFDGTKREVSVSLSKLAGYSGCYTTYAKDTAGQEEKITSVRDGKKVKCSNLGIDSVKINSNNSVTVTLKGESQYYWRYQISNSDKPDSSKWINITSSQFTVTKSDLKTGDYLIVQSGTYPGGYMKYKLTVEQTQSNQSKTIAAIGKIEGNSEGGNSGHLSAKSITIDTNKYKDIKINATATVNAKSGMCKSSSTGASYIEVAVKVTDSNGKSGKVIIAGQEFGTGDFIDTTKHIENNKPISKTIDLSGYSGNVTIELYYSEQDVFCTKPNLNLDYSGSLSVNAVEK